MDNNTFELLKEVEALTDEELKTLITWIEFNISKRKSLQNETINLFISATEGQRSRALQILRQHEPHSASSHQQTCKAQ